MTKFIILMKRQFRPGDNYELKPRSSYSGRAVYLEQVQKMFLNHGKKKTTDRGYNALHESRQWWFWGRLSDHGWCMVCEENSGLPDVKLFVCTLCATSLKLQELSIKCNDYHVYQTEVSRTIISDFSKNSGLSRSQHYSYHAYTALLFIY